MHHIDRTLQELELNSGGNGEYENEFSGNGEFEQVFEQPFGQEANYGSNETFELEQDPELELAYQLLEVSNEYELSHFLGGLINKAVGSVKNAASNFVNSKPGQAVGQYLFKLGKDTIPQLAKDHGGQIAGDYGKDLGQNAGQSIGQAVGGRYGTLGTAAGGFIGKHAGGFIGEQVGKIAGSEAGRRMGTAAGNLIASGAKHIFKLELEALSPEDQELEIARSFVRFATDLTRQANKAVRQNPAISLSDLGKQVITTSARQYAPGLLTGSQSPNSRSLNGSVNGGTWVRKGSTLVVYGV